MEKKKDNAWIRPATILYGFLFAWWFFKGNYAATILTSLFGIFYSLLLIVVPTQMEGIRISFFGHASHNFHVRAMRAIGCMFFAISIFILFRGALVQVSDMGVICLLFFGTFFVLNILWMFFYIKKSPADAKQFAFMNFFFSLIFTATGFILIPMKGMLLHFKPSLWPIMTGIAITIMIVGMFSKVPPIKEKVEE